MHGGRRALLADLTARIRTIERRHGPLDVNGLDGSHAEPSWGFGEPAVDALWPGVLATDAVHEMKPAAAQDWPAALAFTLRLAARRRAALGSAAAMRPLLWCTTTAFTAEHGHLHAPGLAALGLSPDAILVAETARDAETLWVLEEGLRSRVPAVVVGALKGIPTTAARRLSLAAAEAGVPCFALTAPHADGAPSAATRWLIARAASGPHPFDPEAPGAPRARVTLVRCRTAVKAANRTELVEWCDVTHRFRLAASLADRTAAPQWRAATAGQTRRAG